MEGGLPGAAFNQRGNHGGPPFGVRAATVRDRGEKRHPLTPNPSPPQGARGGKDRRMLFMVAALKQEGKSHDHSVQTAAQSSSEACPRPSGRLAAFSRGPDGGRGPAFTHSAGAVAGAAG